MSKDAWGDIPNLSGQRSSSGEVSRTSDPSRFFPSVSKGIVDPVTGRILDVPRVSVYRVGALNIANGGSVITWDTVEYDPLGMFINGQQIQAPVAGLYTCFTWMGFVNVAGSYRSLGFRKNPGAPAGYGNIAIQSDSNPGTGGYSELSISAPIMMNAGDFVDVVAAQGTGAPVAMDPVTSASRVNGFAAILSSTLGSDGQ